MSIGTNNVNTPAMARFVEEVKKDPQKARKKKKIAGKWNFDQEKPQFEANLDFQKGSVLIQSDQPSIMGGKGAMPDPMQYCLFGLAACFAGTFMAISAEKNLAINELKVSAENSVDLHKTLGLSQTPVVLGVKITLEVKSDVSPQLIEEVKNLACERCPGVYCMTNPIPLEVMIRT